VAEILWQETLGGSEETLVSRAMAGDATAFAALTVAYRPGVRRSIAKIISSREVAEDLEQETFLTAFRGLPHLRAPEKFAGWLFAIARNHALRAAAGERFQSQRRVDPAVLESIPASPLPADDWISGRVQSLPDDLRIPAVLHYLEGWPVVKISESLSLPVTNVKWRLHRARQLLRTLCEEDIYHA
jgi:RNA polymerase sigma-70 factor (ECF subfamily)